MKTLKVRLAAMNFLEFAVWGAYLTSLGNYLMRIGLASDIGWFYTVQGIVSLFMPALVGIVADRWVPAQRMLSACHFAAGIFMCAAASYAMTAAEVQFGPVHALLPLGGLFHAHHRPVQLSGFQCAYPCRTRHRETLPAHTCVRYHSLHLLHAPSGYGSKYPDK